MDPSPQSVRTKRPARPRNLAAGCLSLLVIAFSLALCSRCIQATDDQVPTADTIETLPASS